MRSLLVVSIGLIGLLAACATPGDSAAPSESAAEAATAEPSARTPRSAPAVEACPSGELCNARMQPGEYSTDAVGATTLSLTLTSEWDADVHPEVDYVNLYHQGTVPAIIGVAIMADEVFPDPCDDQTTQPIERTPQALMDWLAQHPAMELGEPEEATLGEATGLRVELTATKPEPCPSTSPVAPDLILLWPLSDLGVFLLVDETTAILYALQIGDELVVVTAETIYDPVDWRPVVQEVLDSMEFAAR